MARQLERKIHADPYKQALADTLYDLALKIQREEGLSAPTGAAVANFINRKIQDYDDLSPIQGQHVSYWMLGKYKSEIDGDSARKIGIALGYNFRTAAEDFQSRLRQARRVHLREDAPLRVGTDVVEAIGAATELMLPEYLRAIARRMEQLQSPGASRPMTLCEFLTRKLPQAGIDPSNKSDMEEFAKKCKFDPSKLMGILAGRIYDLDLELYEYGEIAQGLSQVFPGEDWNQKTLLEYLKQGNGNKSKAKVK